MPRKTVWGLSMNKYKLKLSVLTLATAVSLCSLANVSFAQEDVALKSTNSNSFFGNNSEGYWWYKKEPEKQKKKPEKVKPKVEVQIAQEKPKEEPKKVEPPKPKAPEVGSTDWIKVNLESYQKLAIDKPTVENLTAFLYMQRLAIDRAEQFAEAGRIAVMNDPLLDAHAISTMGGGNTAAHEVYLDSEQNHFLKRLYKKIGIFYILKNRCYNCDEQSMMLHYAQKKYGMTVKAISLDELTKGSKTLDYFPDYTIRPNLITKLKIFALPATFLYNAETDQIEPLMQGLATTAEINQRVMNKSMQLGWITKDDYKSVKPFVDFASLSDTFGLGSEFSKKVQSKGGKDPYGKDTNFVNPSDLIKMIRDEKYKHLSDDDLPRGF